MAFSFYCNGEKAEQLNDYQNYTVFGKVIAGMDAVLNISAAPVINNGYGEVSKPLEDIYIEDIIIEESRKQQLLFLRR